MKVKLDKDILEVTEEVGELLIKRFGYKEVKKQSIPQGDHLIVVALLAISGYVMRVVKNESIGGYNNG